LKSYLTIFLLLTFCISSAQISTISNGNWSDTSIWSGGIVPTPADSVIINHFIVYNTNLLVIAGGSVTINDSATLCGRDTFQTLCGGHLYNYGTINASAIYLTDGFNYGWVHALTYYRVSPCIANYNTGRFSVGIDFTCDSSSVIYEDTSHESNFYETPSNVEFNLFPNPVIDYLNITATDSGAFEFVLYDVKASKLIQRTFVNSASLNTELLSCGVYIYELRNKYGIVKRGKIIKQ
jgi:hypothetical protein